jgi:hypothetical protein
MQVVFWIVYGPISSFVLELGLISLLKEGCNEITPHATVIGNVGVSKLLYSVRTKFYKTYSKIYPSRSHGKVLL